MMTQSKAATKQRLIPNKGSAVVTLNGGNATSPQPGTVAGFEKTITGTGTSFMTGNTQFLNNQIIVNDTGGSLNYVLAGIYPITNGTSYLVTGVSSDTSIAIRFDNVNFPGGKAYYVNTVVQIAGAWLKPIKGSLSDYGRMNLQGDETLLHIPDTELNPNGEGREIRTNDQIEFGGTTYQVTSAGATLKTVLTDWVCVCRKVLV